MQTWQPSTLSWSFSKKTHFDSCRRHYFYHRFWGQDPRLRWRLYEMRSLTTLMMLRGQVVHTVIAGALKSARMGQRIDAKAARQNVTDVIRLRYMESANRYSHLDQGLTGKRLRETTCLLEDYYKMPGTPERAREAQQIGWKCVENLVESDFWKQIIDSDTSGWKDIESEQFPSFDLDGIQVYATIDFAHANPGPTIIDWKTGSPNAQDRMQLTLYSLFALAKWDWDPLETNLAVVYLQPELRVDLFKPTPEDIESARAEAKASFSQMLELEPAYGPAGMAAFPISEERRDCAWCRFQGVCEGASRAEESTDGSGTDQADGARQAGMK